MNKGEKATQILINSYEVMNGKRKNGKYSGNKRAQLYVS